MENIIELDRNGSPDTTIKFTSKNEISEGGIGLKLEIEGNAASDFCIC